MSQNIDSLQNEIIRKLEKAFSPQALELIDETHKHKKHRHFQEGKRHFLLIITSAQLKNLSTLKAHQAIYSCLGDLMKDKIHALSIKIL
ncbi:BolA family protein [Fangia hongkongensis]|uniref:BolA family protein n=1 Tax=Fangia hongkongensis TaxID=270495 RepID=UPI00037336E6|nr:BolA family protein [Fangia hongkongensis]MBK2124301.1 BolA family transcriptional regulator [Fangia hongkongensis]